MKIEIAESLILSWLKHEHNCQVVQLNWKPSSGHWVSYNRARLQKIVRDTRDIYLETIKVDIFKQSDPDQILRQAEIDALAIRVEESGLWHLYGVDVAFHESGLGYGENIPTVLKKLVRMALCINGFFNTDSADLIFAAPRIPNSDIMILRNCISNLNGYFRWEQLNFKAELIGNQDFKTTILDAVMKRPSAVSDTSELFLRSVRLLETIDGLRPRRVSRFIGTNGSNDVTCADGGQEQASSSEATDIRVGALVRDAMARLSESDSLSESMMISLQDPEYSREIFGLGYPVLKAVLPDETLSAQRKIEGYDRYYATPYAFRCRNYFLCNYWMPGSRDRFVAWLTSLTK